MQNVLKLVNLDCEYIQCKSKAPVCDDYDDDDDDDNDDDDDDDDDNDNEKDDGDDNNNDKNIKPTICYTTAP